MNFGTCGVKCLLSGKQLGNKRQKLPSLTWKREFGFGSNESPTNISLPLDMATANCIKEWLYSGVIQELGILQNVYFFDNKNSRIRENFSWKSLSAISCNRQAHPYAIETLCRKRQIFTIIFQRFVSNLLLELWQARETRWELSKLIFFDNLQWNGSNVGAGNNSLH